ncbi:flavin reductase [Nocardioides humi]|uniref:IclR-ED domain-containing protein n=1 Tax=Nocardioides humi TaxID=449461 RepID=A0ABN2AH11_9ACTN|nr:flavin reductase [Nocardioides humi]
MTSTTTPPAHDSRHFRDVLGRFPTGVAVVTALDESGTPVGMAVGSFGSVSLDPPLVEFMPARSSSTYPAIARAGRFCVSILGADQEDVCRTMATKGADKFAEIDWHPAPSGAPIIAGALAWIDCTTVQEHEAGDHLIVIGQVEQLSELRPTTPLVFFRGGYGGFSAPSLVAAPERDLIEPIRLAGLARHAMEQLAQEVRAEVIAVGDVAGHTVSLAVADSPGGDYVPTVVGYRTPFVFPVGSVFIAWDEAATDAWLPAAEPARGQGIAALDRVRRRGWAIAIGDVHYDQLERSVSRLFAHDEQASIATAMQRLDGGLFDLELERGATYDVRMLMAPVFGADGGVALGLMLRGFTQHLDSTEILAIADTLTATADEVSRAIGGGAHVPPPSRGGVEEVGRG